MNTPRALRPELSLTACRPVLWAAMAALLPLPALAQPHIRGILAQKPLALTLADAIALRDEAAAAGKILSVNQNMRYDQSMRVLKEILEAGDLGEIVFAQIDMHAIPHWQGFLQDYDRLTLEIWTNGSVNPEMALVEAAKDAAILFR